MFCRSCGNGLKDSEKFCSKCGQAIVRLDKVDKVDDCYKEVAEAKQEESIEKEVSDLTKAEVGKKPMNKAEPIVLKFKHDKYFIAAIPYKSVYTDICIEGSALRIKTYNSTFFIKYGKKEYITSLGKIKGLTEKSSYSIGAILAVCVAAIAVFLKGSIVAMILGIGILFTIKVKKVYLAFEDKLVEIASSSTDDENYKILKEYIQTK